MDKNQLIELFNSFNNKNILIIGDVMVDSYVIGNVSRISPEAPVPVLSLERREERLGGASNVALNIQSMGANPLLCSVIGKNETGDSFLELLGKQNISNKGIIIQQGRKTSKKTRIIAHNQHLLRVDEEDVEEIDDVTEKKLINTITDFISNTKVDGIILQDYNKGVLSKNIIQKIIEISSNKNIPILADPKKLNFDEYKNITLFKPNLKELKEGLNIILDINNNKEIHNRLIKFITDRNIKYMLLTLSEHGVIICSEKEFHHIPTQIRDIADVSGAGDTVISVVSLCVASNVPLYDAAFISNLAAGIVCESAGVVPVNKEKLLQKLVSMNQ